MLSKINKSWVNESREATEERYNNTKLGYVVVIGGGFVSAAFVALLTYNIFGFMERAHTYPYLSHQGERAAKVSCAIWSTRR